jgi:hypothetical protein
VVRDAQSQSRASIQPFQEIHKLTWNRLVTDTIVHGPQLIADFVLDGFGRQPGPTHVAPLLANK